MAPSCRFIWLGWSGRESFAPSSFLWLTLHSHTGPAACRPRSSLTSVVRSLRLALTSVPSLPSFTLHSSGVGREEGWGRVGGKDRNDNMISGSKFQDS